MVDVFFCVCVVTFDVYIPGLRRSDRFLRRTAPPCHRALSLPFFLKTFLHSPLEVATDVVLKSFFSSQASDYSNSSS